MKTGHILLIVGAVFLLYGLVSFGKAAAYDTEREIKNMTGMVAPPQIPGVKMDARTEGKVKEMIAANIKTIRGMRGNFVKHGFVGLVIGLGCCLYGITNLSKKA